VRVVFFGTPAFSVPTLRALVEAGHDVVLVVTQPDRRRGRGKEPSPSPVKVAATELGIPVSHRVADVLELEADVGVLVAFGRIIKPAVLERLTILNLHPSLLPRWRGATPIEAAILAGDDRTGICVMELVDEMDAGPVHASIAVDIAPGEPASSLYDRLFALGTDLLVELLAVGLGEPEPQVGEPTFCGKIAAEDLHIDWARPAEQTARLARIERRPWTTFRGRRLIVVDAVASGPAQGEPGELRGAEVATGDGALVLRRVQPEGKPVQRAEDWLRGARPEPGERFA